MNRLQRVYVLFLFITVILYIIGSPQTVYAAGKTLAAPTTVKAVSTSYSSVSISWSSVQGATGYRLYRANSSTGSFALIKTTTAKSYKDIGLVTGTTYYYKVKAYQTGKGSKVFSKYTVVVKAKPILKIPASIHAIASPDGVIAVAWEKSQGAVGYEVYKAAEKEGTYALLTTVTSIGYSDTGLAAGTSCYYKIRAYSNITGKKVYSGYTDIVSGTIPIINVTSVSLNKNESAITLGSTEQLTPSITPLNATNQKIAWKSSDENVATVDTEGYVTSVNTGTAVITVTTADGNYSADCIITVADAQIMGIDVSKWQKTIQWDLVKNSGVEFAMLRSTYGSSSVDPMFEINYQGAKDNGIAVGVYHYSYATTLKKAAAEVEFLISELEGKQLEYPVCVDVEDKSMSKLDKATLTDIALTYLDGLTAAGYYPIIYSNKTWFTSKLDDTRLTTYDHWLAQWGTSITYTGKVGIWQYSATGKIDGISGSVDMDTSFIDYATLIKRLGLNGF
jgi:GH25 family lysozyme M1 (1,4-beta-N-acetylmuramidase)